MHPANRFVRHTGFSVLCLFALAVHAADHNWVHGSWVNLRAEPSSDARVITQLTTNTPVSLHDRRGEWCEISTISDSVRGHVACRLIGEKPLALPDLGMPRNADGAPNPDYIASRAFWIAPSIRSLLEAGDFYWRTMLNASQRASEQIDTYREPDKELVKPRRFPIPEFEAMKARMQKGVVAPVEARPAVISWSTLKNAKPERGLDYLVVSGRWIEGNMQQIIQSGNLAPVKPSLFRQVTDLSPASATVEQLSAQFGIPEQAMVLSGAEWGHHRHDEPRIFGYWDIGSLQLRLQKPVVEFVIGRQGLASALQWNAEETQDYKAESYCTEGFSLKQRAAQRLPGYPQVKDPLVWFYVPAALPYKKVEIKTIARRLDPPADKKNSGHRSYSLIVMREIDIDSDGVPDISAWEVMGQSAMMGYQPGAGDSAIMRIAFANIGGEWHLLDLETYGECT